MRPTIVVVGSGYGGVLAANRVAGRLGSRGRVVLVSDRDELVHRVRLHEVAAGARTRRYPLDELVQPAVERVHARVDVIDVVGRSVRAGGADLGYDHLIYAVGSGLASSAPGALAHGSALAGPEAAEAFAQRVGDLAAGEHVVVVGGGLTGIEAAAELAEAHPRLVVTLLGALAPAWDGATRAIASAELEALGVRLRPDARAVAVGPSTVTLETGEELPAAATIWATGFAASGLARASGLPVDATGRLVVDEALRVPGRPEVVGCGDAIAAPVACAGTGRTPLRMACATAFPTAGHAADVVVDTVLGRTPRTFRYDNTVHCVSFGRRRGLLVFIDADDRPTGRVWTGRLGALAKEVIVTGVIAALRLERWVPGSYAWPGTWRRSRVVPEVRSLVDGALA